MKSNLTFEYKTESLKFLIEKIIDHRGKTPKKLGTNWTDTGFPVLSAKNVKNGFLTNLEQLRFIDRESYNKWMPEKIKPDDILLTSEGPLGELFYVKEDFFEFCIGQRLFAIRTNPSKLDSRYFFYFLKSQVGQHQLHARATGSTVQGIRQSELEKISITYPKLPKQQQISKILSSFDNKLDVLSNLNQIQEKFLQSIFKSWFIDFDGKRDFIDSELGKIPKGWKVDKISNVIECLDLKRIPLSSMERRKRKGKFPYYGASGIIDYIDEYIFDENLLLIAEDGENLRSRKTPIAFTADGKFWVNNHAHVIKGKNNISNEYLRLFFDFLDLSPWITGAAQPKLNQENLFSIPLVVPPNTILIDFNNQTKIISESIKKNNSQIQKLSKILNSLVPRFLGGEIKV